MMARMVFGVVCVWAGHVGAQETLQDFLNAAQTHHIDKKIAVEQSAYALNNLGMAWTGLMPSLTAQASYVNNQYPASTQFPNGGELVFIPKNQWDASLRVDMPLIDFTRWMRIRSMDATYEASKERTRQASDMVKRQVVYAYYNHGAALALRASAQKSLDVAHTQQVLTETRFKLGTLTELEVLRAKSEVQRAKQYVADADMWVSTTRQSLFTLCGREPSSEVVLPEDPLQAEQPVDHFLQHVDTTPPVKAAVQEAKAAGAVLKTAVFSTVPSLGAQFTQRFTNATGFVGKEATYVGGLSLTWRLDIAAPYGIRSASSMAQVALLGVEKARRMVREQIYADWYKLEASLAKVQASRSQYEAANRAVQVVRNRYAVGAVTQLDLIQAERDFLSVEASRIQSQAELLSARVALRLSAGLSLDTL
jgi:outer membrane protein TolC